MRLKEFFSLFLVVLLLGFISASFTLGTPSYYLQDSYEQGDRISGWINVSFTDEPYNSTFTDSFGNTVLLQTLLNNNPSYDYNNTLPSLTSEMQLLSLDEIFLIPSLFGELNYEFNFTNINLFTEQIIMNSSYNLTLKVQAARAINDKKQELEKFKLEKQSYTGFIGARLDYSFNVFYFEDKISELEDNYTSASSNQGYQEIINELDLMRIPKSISESNSINNLNFYPRSENIEFGVLAGITGEDYSELNSANYETSLFIWSQDAIDARINYKGISASYGVSEEILFNYFEVQFIRTPPMIDVYLIIDDMIGLEFEGEYGQQLRGTHYFINLKNMNYEDVVFAISENVDFTTLPMFISPSLADLPNSGNVIIDGKKEMKISKWFFFGLIILFVLVIGLVVYSVVSTWYDKKYEKHLFPNRNNLYNLIIFINTSNRKGISNDEIVKSLRKSKWSGEQIKYVMKKYAGKRTGMVKLPFNKIQKAPKKPDRSVNPGPIRGPTGNPPSTRNTSFRRPGSGIKR